MDMFSSIYQCKEVFENSYSVADYIQSEIINAQSPVLPAK